MQKRGMRCKKRRPVRATLYFLSRELATSLAPQFKLARELRVLSQTQSTDD